MTMENLMHTYMRQLNRLTVVGRKATLVAAVLMLFGSCAKAQVQPAASPNLVPTTPVPAAQVGTATLAAGAQQPAVNAPQEAQTPQTLHILVGHSLLITSPTRIAGT